MYDIEIIVENRTFSAVSYDNETVRASYADSLDLCMYIYYNSIYKYYNRY